jgi:hypothetical protein
MSDDPIKEAAKQGFRYTPDTEEAVKRAMAEKLAAKKRQEADNEAAFRRALEEAERETPGVEVRQSRKETSKEKAASEKAMREGSENEVRAPYKKGGKIEKSKDKNWISKAIKKPGALRESLGVKEGEKIPAKKLASAAKKPGKMGQRARLAQTLKGFKEGGHIRGSGCESRGKTRGKFV